MQAALARPVEIVWSLDWGAEHAAVSENCCWLLDCWCWCFAAWRAVAMRCDGRAAACVSDYSSDALLPVPYYLLTATGGCGVCGKGAALARMSALLRCGCLSQQRALAHLAAGGRRV
jgi:hypothetical protein